MCDVIANRVDAYPKAPDYHYDWDVLLSEYKFSRETGFGKNGHGEAADNVTKCDPTFK